MTIALVAIAILLIITAISLRKFMRDMAVVEEALITELREIKACLVKINEKQL